MTRAEFLAYKSSFVDAIRPVLATGASRELSEAAFPAYANPNPWISFLFWQRIRKVMQRLETGARYRYVMDFGCGGGVMLPFLGRVSERVVALDINLGPYRRMASLMTFPSNVEVHTVREKPLGSFAASTFDVISALDVLEHVDDLAATVDELDRVLAPRGKIVVSGPTENVAYQIGRRIAGAEYSGDYHARDIYQIKRAMCGRMRVRTLATLYYPVPLFKIYLAEKP